VFSIRALTLPTKIGLETKS